jgi:hypothetical protein
VAVKSGGGPANMNSVETGPPSDLDERHRRRMLWARRFAGLAVLGSSPAVADMNLAIGVLVALIGIFVLISAM